MIAEKIENYIKTLDNIGADCVLKTAAEVEKHGAVDSRVASDILLIAADEVNADFVTVSSVIVYAFLPRETIMQLIENKVFADGIESVISGIMKIPEFNLEKIKSQNENHIKLLVTLSGDVRAIIVLLIEHLEKIRRLSQLSEDEAFKTATEVQYLYSPVAHRIGLYKIKTEMEEVCLKYFNYSTYRHIADKLQIKKAERDEYIAEFIAPLKKKFAEHNLKVSIKGRPKSIASIYNKMKNQNIDVDGIYDLFAIRVIIDSAPDSQKEKADCWKVYSIITEKYKPNPYRLRDWISVPKSSGYESLHTTVIGPGGRWVEVQIRTVRMDEIAEKGLAAHWKYKNGTDGQAGGNIFSKIREAIENPDITKNISAEKKALYSDEIYIFTPDGDLIKMHTGDTVLDFAFSIHSDLGSKCIGAKVNNKFVSISYELQNGDTIKVLTSGNQRPSPDWVNVANNQRVKNRIRRVIQNLENRLAEVGKDVVRQKLQQFDLQLIDTNVSKLIKFFDKETTIELYQAVGEGKIDPQKVRSAIAQIIEQENRPTEEKHSLNQPLEKIAGNYKNSDVLVIDNLNTLDFTFAKCCQPLPGDKIFAFITSTKGTKIHRFDCPNAKTILSKYPYRVLEAVWKKDIDAQMYNTVLKISGLYDVGIGLQINNLVINEFKMHIRSFSVTELPGGKFSGELSVNVVGANPLKSLVERLKRIKNIEKVEVVS